MEVELSRLDLSEILPGELTVGDVEAERQRKARERGVDLVPSSQQDVSRQRYHDLHLAYQYTAFAA